jgi:hypothetical protein
MRILPGDVRAVGRTGLALPGGLARYRLPAFSRLIAVS